MAARDRGYFFIRFKLTTRSSPSDFNGTNLLEASHRLFNIHYVKGNVLETRLNWYSYIIIVIHEGDKELSVNMISALCETCFFNWCLPFMLYMLEFLL